MYAALEAIVEMNAGLHADREVTPRPGRLNEVLRSVARIAHHDHLVLVMSDFDGIDETTDTAGGYDYTGGVVSTGLNGQWFDTTCLSCDNPAQPSVELDFGAGILDFGTGGQDGFGNGFSTPADRNTFYHLNQIRRVTTKWLPSFPWLDTTIGSFVNIDATCNAYYDGSVNFYRSGGGCNNTGEIADVITHEWGHGADLNSRGGDGATGEATADVVAMHLSHSPLIGPGFRTDGDPVRNLDSTGPRGLLTATNISDICPSPTNLEAP